jgi:hypothetical protein
MRQMKKLESNIYEYDNNMEYNNNCLTCMYGYNQKALRNTPEKQAMTLMRALNYAYQLTFVGNYLLEKGKIAKNYNFFAFL